MLSFILNVEKYSMPNFSQMMPGELYGHSNWRSKASTPLPCDSQWTREGGFVGPEHILHRESETN